MWHPGVGFDAGMHKLLVTAGLVAGLATAATSFAATDTGAPDTASQQPLLGSWAMTVDGSPVGSLSRVSGCSPNAGVVTDAGTTAKHLVPAAPEPCRIEFGAGMSASFYSLVNDALLGNGGPHQVQLIRTDSAAANALDLNRAQITSVTLPKVSRADGTPAFIQATLSPTAITRGPGNPTIKAQPVRGFATDRLDVIVGGKPLSAGAAGPWTATIKPANFDPRSGNLTQTSVTVGDLPIAVPELAKTAVTVMDPWVQSAMVDMTASAQPVTVQLGGISLALDRSAPDRADLAPRADGTRTYDLFAERAQLR
jgi:hypothetical protein